MRIAAPAKINLCLFLGPRRADGLHELCSLFEPLALADSLLVTELGEASEDGEGEASDRDEVICPGVEGENLASRALAALRERGWTAPSLRIEIRKRIPVAAGLGGGSADAAAVLRLARDRTAQAPPRADTEAAAGQPGLVADLAEIAAALGADVPSQLVPELSLVQGAGERVERLPSPPTHAAVLLPAGGGLSTAAVFAEADRLGLGRDEAELESLAEELREAAGSGASPFDYAGLLVNDLEPAALSLRPDIGEALDALRGLAPNAKEGEAPNPAPLVFMSGSGPTAVGLFPSLGEARRAGAQLDREDAIVCEAGRAP